MAYERWMLLDVERALSSDDDTPLTVRLSDVVLAAYRRGANEAAVAAKAGAFTPQPETRPEVPELDEDGGPAEGAPWQGAALLSLPFKPTHQHYKNGALYELLAHGLRIGNGIRAYEVAVYRDVGGRVYVRPIEEWREEVQWPGGAWKPRYNRLNMKEEA